MCKKIITAVFDNEKTAYRAILELQKNYVTRFYTVYDAVLIKRHNEVIIPVYGFNASKGYINETYIGGLIGAITEALSEPLETYKALPVLKSISKDVVDDKTAVLFDTAEFNDSAFDYIFDKFSVLPKRIDFSVIKDEVKTVQDLTEKGLSQKKIDLRRFKVKEDIS